MKSFNKKVYKCCKTSKKGHFGKESFRKSVIYKWVIWGKGRIYIGHFGNESYRNYRSLQNRRVRKVVTSNNGSFEKHPSRRQPPTSTIPHLDKKTTLQQKDFNSTKNFNPTKTLPIRQKTFNLTKKSSDSTKNLYFDKKALIRKKTFTLTKKALMRPKSSTSTKKIQLDKEPSFRHKKPSLQQKHFQFDKKPSLWQILIASESFLSDLFKSIFFEVSNAWILFLNYSSIQLLYHFSTE